MNECLEVGKILIVFFGKISLCNDGDEALKH